MGARSVFAFGLLASGIMLSPGALALEIPSPPVTFVEVEDEATDNDSFPNSSVIQAPLEEDADCFFITGKLQEDCVWDREFKCYLARYSKAFSAIPVNPADGDEVLVERIVQTSSAGFMVVTDLQDGVVRLAVANFYDAFDGTINGLFSNGLHGETGRIRLTVDFLDNGALLEAKEYEFDFKSGGEALRLSCEAPVGADTAIINCFGDVAQKPVCYDVDHYVINGLTPREFYCVTVIGGSNADCEPTDTLIGWFDKLGNLQGGIYGVNDDAGSPYSQLCVFADDVGIIAFAITGSGDEDFNGLDDALQEDYFVYLEDEGYLVEGFIPGTNWVTGASLKDHTAASVIRLSVSDFNDQSSDGGDGYHCPPEHGVCGGYCIKVIRVPHDVDDDDGGEGGGPLIDPGGGQIVQPKLTGHPDLNMDGHVDALDLATLLSYWGPMP